MTRKELVELLMTIPEDMPVTHIFLDFPTDFKGVEVIDVTRPYPEAGYYYQSFYPEVEEVPVIKIAVLS